MKKYIFGIFLILFGISLLLNSLGVFNMFEIFAGWWTLFIIVPACINLFFTKDKNGSLVALSLGISLLLQQQNIVSISMACVVFFSFLIIIAGFNMLLKKHK